MKPGPRFLIQIWKALWLYRSCSDTPDVEKSHGCMPMSHSMRAQLFENGPCVSGAPG